MNFIKKIKNEDGFSLLELIIGLFVMAIVIIAFTNLITVSIQGIFGAGSKSSALLDAQEGVDKSIAGGLSEEFDPDDPDKHDKHQIVFNDGIDEITIHVKGEEIEIEEEYEEGRLVHVRYFLPESR